MIPWIASDILLWHTHRHMATLNRTSGPPCDEVPPSVFELNERAGLRPEDVSISGFNDMPFVGTLSPSLATLYRPLDESTVIAANKLHYDSTPGRYTACPNAYIGLGKFHH